MGFLGQELPGPIICDECTCSHMPVYNPISSWSGLSGSKLPINDGYLGSSLPDYPGYPAYTAIPLPDNLTL